MVTTDRRYLRSTFDSAVDRYQRARPDYPPELFETLIRVAGIQSGDRLLEVGCATGKATIPLAQRGFRIACVEIGPDLAAAAKRNLAAYPNTVVFRGAFETWTPPGGDRFDLVFAATAWHWIDPDVRYVHAAELLRRGGHLAFWSASHVFPAGGDPFFVEIQHIYDEIGESTPSGEPRYLPGELPDGRHEIEETGLFDDVVTTQFDWETQYTADEYLDLLDTFSGHIAMRPAQRQYLYAEIRRRLARRLDGRLRRHWGAVLHVARRAV